MPLLLKKQPNVKLLLVGKGPIMKDLEDQAIRLDIKERVVFTGFRMDIGDLLYSCDIVVSPTLREGLSVSLLEALAMGKPIVTTNISSNREIIKDRINGLLVPPGEVKPLADAILFMIGDPVSASKYSNAAKDRYFAYFTEEAMQSRLWNIYEDLINSKLPNRCAI